MKLVNTVGEIRGYDKELLENTSKKIYRFTYIIQLVKPETVAKVDPSRLLSSTQMRELHQRNWAG